MERVGTLKEIWRYPVKGMAGERVSSCAIGPAGLAGDRIFALRDAARAEIQSCKVRPQLLLCRAHTSAADASVAEIELPGGELLRSDDPRVHERLSLLTGHASTLEALRPAQDSAFYRRYKRDEHTWLREIEATFEREPGEPLPDLEHLPPHLVDHVSIPGTFFLVTPMHLITTATLAALRAANPGAQWDVRRFRPNLVIDTGDGSIGAVEQGWIGRRLVIGAAVIDCVGATPRCGAIARAQPEVGSDSSVLRTVVRTAAQNAGIYGTIGSPGELRGGMEVLLD